MIYFISDIHLGAAYVLDRRAHEARMVDFLRSIEGKVTELYLLGDILDYWFEYRTAVPRGYVRFFGQLARMADAGVRIVWFTGNHDIWLFDYLRTEIGMEVIDAPAGGLFRDICGTRFLLEHGDTFGPQPRSYLMLRSLFRNRLCQKMYSAIHPRWSIPFAHAWSSHSRKGSAYPEGGMLPQVREMLIDHATAVAHANPDLKYIVIGHHHTPMVVPLDGSDCTLIVLGSCITSLSYAIFDPSTGVLELVS